MMTDESLPYTFKSLWSFPTLLYFGFGFGGVSPFGGGFSGRAGAAELPVGGASQNCQGSNFNQNNAGGLAGGFAAHNCVGSSCNQNN